MKKPGMGKGAFSLVEVILVMALVAIALGPLLYTFTTSLEAVQASDISWVGERLAQNMMNEILSKGFSDPDEAAQMGLEASEKAILAGIYENDPESPEFFSRLLFDDVDDYHDWPANIYDAVNGEMPPDFLPRTMDGHLEEDIYQDFRLGVKVERQTESGGLEWSLATDEIELGLEGLKSMVSTPLGDKLLIAGDSKILAFSGYNQRFLGEVQPFFVEDDGPKEIDWLAVSPFGDVAVAGHSTPWPHVKQEIAIINLENLEIMGKWGGDLDLLPIKQSGGGIDFTVLKDAGDSCLLYQGLMQEFKPILYYDKEDESGEKQVFYSQGHSMDSEVFKPSQKISFDSTQSDLTPDGFSSPCVIYRRNGDYIGYFTAHLGDAKKIIQAWSYDGISFFDAKEPFESDGDQSVYNPWVAKDHQSNADQGGENRRGYRMWYMLDDGQNGQIMTRFSRDGLVWGDAYQVCSANQDLDIGPELFPPYDSGGMGKICAVAIPDYGYIGLYMAQSPLEDGQNVADRWIIQSESQDGIKWVNPHIVWGSGSHNENGNKPPAFLPISASIARRPDKSLDILVVALDPIKEDESPSSTMVLSRIGPQDMIKKPLYIQKTGFSDKAGFNLSDYRLHIMATGGRRIITYDLRFPFNPYSQFLPFDQVGDLAFGENRVMATLYRGGSGDMGTLFATGGKGQVLRQNDKTTNFTGKSPLLSSCDGKKGIVGYKDNSDNKVLRQFSFSNDESPVLGPEYSSLGDFKRVAIIPSSPYALVVFDNGTHYEVDILDLEMAQMADNDPRIPGTQSLSVALELYDPNFNPDDPPESFQFDSSTVPLVYGGPGGKIYVAGKYLKNTTGDLSLFVFKRSGIYKEITVTVSHIEDKAPPVELKNRISQWHSTALGIQKPNIIPAPQEINKNTVWKGGGKTVRLIKEPLIISSGIRLTIRPGMVIRFGPNGSIENRGELIIGRPISPLVEITDIDPGLNPFYGEDGDDPENEESEENEENEESEEGWKVVEPVVFISADDLSFLPPLKGEDGKILAGAEPVKWKGLNNIGGSFSLIDNAYLKGAESEQSSDGYAIFADGASTVQIKDSNISHCPKMVLKLNTESEKTVLQRVLFQKCGTPVFAESVASAQIKGSFFLENQATVHNYPSAISLQSGKVIIQDSSFIRNSMSKSIPSSSTTSTAIDMISGDGEASNIIVQNSIFLENMSEKGNPIFGIRSGSAVLTDNIFAFNKREAGTVMSHALPGVLLVESETNIQAFRNIFLNNNPCSLGVEHDGQSEKSINYNLFSSLDIAYYDAHISDSAYENGLRMPFNWWNSNLGPDSSKVKGLNIFPVIKPWALAGIIRENQSWPQENSPTAIIDSILIEPGISLNLPPDGIYKAMVTEPKISLVSAGENNIVGNDSKPTFFTSLNHDIDCDGDDQLSDSPIDGKYEIFPLSTGKPMIDDWYGIKYCSAIDENRTIRDGSFEASSLSWDISSPLGTVGELVEIEEGGQMNGAFHFKAGFTETEKSPVEINGNANFIASLPSGGKGLFYVLADQILAVFAQNGQLLLDMSLETCNVGDLKKAILLDNHHLLALGGNGLALIEFTNDSAGFTSGSISPLNEWLGLNEDNTIIDICSESNIQGTFIYVAAKDSGALILKKYLWNQEGAPTEPMLTPIDDFNSGIVVEMDPDSAFAMICVKGNVYAVGVDMDSGDDCIKAFDSQDGSMKKLITTGLSSGTVIPHPKRNEIFMPVLSLNDAYPFPGFHTINCSQKKIIKDVELDSEMTSLYGACFEPDGRLFFVIAEKSPSDDKDYILVTDRIVNKIIDTVRVDKGTKYCAISPSGDILATIAKTESNKSSLRFFDIPKSYHSSVFATQSLGHIKPGSYENADLSFRYKIIAQSWEGSDALSTSPAIGDFPVMVIISWSEGGSTQSYHYGISSTGQIESGHNGVVFGGGLDTWGQATIENIGQNWAVNQLLNISIGGKGTTFEGFIDDLVLKFNR